MLGNWAPPIRRLALLTPILALALVATGQEPAPREAPSRGERLLELHRNDAATYQIYRDSARTQPLELRREPIYRWSNPTRSGGQEGDVFVWTDRGRPEAIASLFSHPHQKIQRTICHELHSLSEAVLVVDRNSPNRWTPQGPGVAFQPIPNAPSPAATPPARLTQLRALARDFSGRSLSDQQQAWPLRILPRPLYRYESNHPEVIDGAVFALVSSAGTDPEIILLIEVRKSATGPQWDFAAARFSDHSLWLKYKDTEVWNMLRGPDNTFDSDAQQRFRFYKDRRIPELDGVTPPAAEPPAPVEAKTKP